MFSLILVSVCINKWWQSDTHILRVGEGKTIQTVGMLNGGITG